jgi:hypothetical protein
MGKAIKEARSEVEKCAWAMDYYADNGKVFTTDEVAFRYVYSYELTYITYSRMYRTVACLLCNLQAVVKPSDNWGMLLWAIGEDALRQRPYFAGIALLQVE